MLGSVRSMNKKLIAIDIDGTLINDDKKIMPQTEKILKKLSDEGHYIVLCSGRALNGIKPYLEQLDLWGKSGQYGIAFNGGNIYDLGSNKSIVSSYLTSQETIKADQLAHKIGVNGEVITSSNRSYVVNGEDSVYAKIDRSDSRLEFHKTDNYDFLKNEHVQKYLWTDEPKVVSEHIKDIPQEYFDEYQIVRSGPIFLEFLPMDVNKGNAVKKLANKLGIDRQDVIVFGDEENDLAMFEYAGTAVAMKNARDEIREYADLISLADNNHDGVGVTLAKIMKDEN